MSNTSSPPEQTGPRLETLIIGAIAVVMLGALWYVFSQQQQSLRRSPSGHDGLQIWLAANDVSAQNFTGGWLIDETSVGLLVLPLYDSELDKDRVSPTTQQELLLQQDEYDLATPIIRRKAQRVPALVILPKWRTGMRLTGIAHPILNIEADRTARTLRNLTGDRQASLVSSRTPFTDFSYRSHDGEGLTARLYDAQMFKSDACTPIIGRQDAMLLASCTLAAAEGSSDDRVMVLSDPDLLNNHGLRLGDNALIALDLMRAEAETGNIVIDYSRDVWLRDPYVEPERERTWDDLARFFGPPFLALWFGAALVLALFLWRASARYGAVRPESTALGAGKDIAVQARARLLRLSGQDGALAREYATARLAATASALFGPSHARHYAGEAAFLNYTERRHPALAPRLRGVLDAIHQLPARLTAAEAIHHIDQLEQVLEQITHDA
ncbi:hypothetical protein [Labrenzia sp. VG12]|uniref:hypothetical protein n=1 Tax=Labrenzia sp. VG12 TaxID=2021862 RepID=UPI000B8BB963|nr:hypothetical protein [Labrenzia sp. VG12]ASP34937.1 hypothetical protein CHH27_18230 [Labrenzia sp. VG12]